MTGYSTTALTMIGEALASPEAERQKEGLIMSAVLFERHRRIEVELVEPFRSVELSEDFIDCLFAIVRGKALDERVLPSVLGTAVWTLGKCHEMRSLAAVSKVVRDQMLTPEVCYQAAIAMEKQLEALGENPTAVRLFLAAVPNLAEHRKDERLNEVVSRLEERHPLPVAT